MKVNTPGDIAGLNGSGHASTASQRAVGKGSTGLSGLGDSVRLSALSRDIATLAAPPDETMEAFNAERVAQIREAIAEGSFRVNPEAVADSLLASVHEMLEVRRKS